MARAEYIRSIFNYGAEILVDGRTGLPVGHSKNGVDQYFARFSDDGTSLVDGAGNSIYSTTAVASSRDLTNADNGKTLECTATVTLTVPIGLMTNFGCAIIPNGTTSIASSGGALINGATTTLTRAASANAVFAIVPRASAANSYVVTGA